LCGTTFRSRRSYPRNRARSAGAAVGFGGTTSFLGVAPDGGIYVAGGFDGTGVFGTSAQDSAFPTQFVAYIDPTGSITATGSWVAKPPGGPPALALAKDGSFFQASDIDFRRVAPTTGSAVWSSPTPTWFLPRMAAATNVIVAGEFLMPTDFDFGAGQALLQDQGSFLASYTTGGQLLWVRQLNVATNDGVIIGLDGSLYYLNILWLPLTDFDPGPAVDAIQVTNYDCLITKFAP
jgi:hypothetical protein